MPEKRLTRTIVHSSVVRLASNDFSVIDILNQKKEDPDEVACQQNDQIGLIEVIATEILSEKVKPN